jgi:hypothetical protein
VGRFRVASGAILSGHVASGQIGTGHLADGAVTSGDIASGVVSKSHISSGAIASGQVASGAVGGQAGTTINIQSGTIRHNDFGSGAIQSGDIASGQIGGSLIASGGVTSGHIASGQVGPAKLSSGAVQSGHINSGNIITYGRVDCEDTYVTTETISGVRAVQITRSGFLQIAMAAVSGRMPADGIAFGNALSGAALLFIITGRALGPAAEIGSGLCISGRMGSKLWVGASGQVVTISGGGPTIGVGATNSGAIGQLCGRITSSGQVFITMDQGQYSGAAVITTDTRFWPL